MKEVKEHKELFQKCLSLKCSGNGREDLFWEALNRANNTIDALIDRLLVIEDMARLSNKESDE